MSLMQMGLLGPRLVSFVELHKTESGHASRVAAQQEQLANRMEEIDGASGLRRMEVLEQRQNSAKRHCCR